MQSDKNMVANGVIAFTSEPSGLTMPEKIFCIWLWFIIEFLGNGLIIGTIQFDRFGGDPLKRRITDQVSCKKTLKILCKMHLFF